MCPLLFERPMVFSSNLRTGVGGLPQRVRIHLISSLVLTYLDYAAVVFADLSKILERKLAKIQNRIIRFIFGSRRGTPTYPYGRKLEWLSTAGR